jgi:DUF4097 and DUF4098 domain-containing protein YvlB
LAAAAVTLLVGCAWDEAAFHQTTTVKAPHASGQGLKVTARNGWISVHRESGAEVQIVATVKMVSEQRLGEATLVADRNAEGVLEVYAKPPPGGWKSSEGVDFDISTPEAVPVNLTTDNGRIESAGMTGRGVFETSNGSVMVLNHDGPVEADTSNGKVEISGANGPVKAKTSNGSVRVVLSERNPGPVHIDTSNGAVSLELGRSFRGELTVDTSNGSITLPDAGGDLSVKRHGRHSATLRFGEGGEPSSIETSNGRVHVRR